MRFHYVGIDLGDISLLLMAVGFLVLCIAGAYAIIKVANSEDE